ncbi:MAG: glycosyltransferase family 2 protein [Candidatus Nealsonbacteria bacterium]|nr:glycosyltransferase family 2 protein [Candidatus Nealsonbacteria bacterium]
MSNNIYLSVVIPAYNEEKRLPKTLKDVDSYLSKQNYNYEIIVVSDGSKDKTGDNVRGLMSQIKNLKFIDNKENHGKGFVTRQGMLEAKGSFRVFMDADNSTNIDQVEKMWPFFKQGYDVLVGSRSIKGAILDPPQGFTRKLTGNAFRLLTDIFTGLWDIDDSQCGFKGFTAKASETIFPKCKIDRFSFDAEILVIAKKLKYKIKEFPITWKNDLESKVQFKSMVKMGFDLVKISINIITRKYD